MRTRQSMLPIHMTKSLFVRWGATTSTQFTVANGVQQSGIISPILFNVYMDDLSKAINSSGIGGGGGRGWVLRSIFFNHLCYADDLCLISPSSIGIQQLLTYTRIMPLIINYCIMVLSHFLYVSKTRLLKLHNHIFSLMT